MSKLPTEEKLTEILEEYFQRCRELKKMPTKGGVCLELDITRRTYNIWKKKSKHLKRAEEIIEDEWVQTLRANNVAGTIFYLKNAFGWRDKKETEISGGLGVRIEVPPKDKGDE